MENETWTPHRVAVIQHPPVFLDRAATLERAVTLLNEAANNGAQLVVFSEAFIPGYPAWIGRVRYRDDGALVEELHARLVANAVNLASDDLQMLRQAAQRRAVAVVCGIQERDGQYSGGTLYNTDVPATLPRHDALFGDRWLHDGDSVIINPTGNIVAGPLHRTHGILYAECTPDQAVAMRRRIDVAGHYGRPDLFHLEVNRAPMAPIHFRDDNEPGS